MLKKKQKWCYKKNKKKTRMGEVTWEKERNFSALLKHEEEAAGSSLTLLKISHTLSLSYTHTIVSPERRERRE